MDTLDDRQGLSGQRQDMSAAIVRVRHTLDQTSRLQSVEQANEGNWPDVENLRDSGLIEPFVVRQVDENSVSRASHTWKLGAQLPVTPTARQPGCLMQQADNIWNIGAGIVIGRRCRPRSGGLLQQMVDGRLVGSVAMHEQLHDRLRKELIKRRLIGSVEI